MQKPKSAPIRFLYKEDISKRENYRVELNIEPDQLSHIVGVFNLDQSQSFRCGLNNCRQEHWNGVIIAAKNGLETHCGLICGAREFPEDFKSKHALFRNALRRQESINTVLELKKNGALFLKEAQELQGLIDSVYSGFQFIRKSLRTPVILNRHIESIFRSGGIVSISIEMTEDEREASGGKQRFRTQPVGKIQGVTVLRDFAKASVEIGNLIRDLRKVQSLHPEKSSARVISQCVRINNNIRSDLDSARYFIDETNRFLTQENYEELKKLVVLDGVKDTDLIDAFGEFHVMLHRKQNRASELIYH